jgi:RNA polymerase sigma-70 factor (ECF subfamily)
MSDVALAERVLAGDEAAFDEFFVGNFPRLYRFALARLGGNEDAAEEIAQRVMIRALHRLHTYRGEAALLTWLCTLCRREIAGWLEREGRLREVSFSDDRPELRAVLDAIAAADAADPEDVVRRREVSDLVHATLDHLPGRYGEVLEWKYIQGLSVDEIAARLGLGYKAAESLLSRARAAFRDGFSFVTGDWLAIEASGQARSAESS